tara:strand:- start:108 stop:1040 length:933 start_codon:yes stop_codon:yes gene_type:complete
MKGIIKYGSNIEAISLDQGKYFKKGERFMTLSKRSNSRYTGQMFIEYRGSQVIANIEMTLYGADRMNEFNLSKFGSFNMAWNRVWPSNFKAHNDKFKKEAAKAAEKKKPSGGGSGTAFFINDKGLLITNNHVVEGCKTNSKIIYKDKEYDAKLIAKDKLLDFALLKTDITKNKFLVLSENPPKKLQRIIAAGYPLGKSLSDDLKFTSGIISSLKGADDDSTLIQIDAALNPGNSGGPIVDDKTGELVAVAVAGMRKDRTEAINFGIKTNSLKNFLDSNQIKPPGSKLLFSFGSVDVSQILEESTVYTYCK